MKRRVVSSRKRRLSEFESTEVVLSLDELRKSVARRNAALAPRG